MVKKFELFEVKPNALALKAFREEYIKTFDGSPLCKILSRTDKWYKNGQNIGVYNSSKLGIGIVPIVKGREYKKRSLDLDKFIVDGPCNVNQARAIKMKQDDIYKVNYFYLFEGPCASSSKLNGYTTPSLLINEDIYNMIMIQFRSFSRTTTPNDLSRYQDYFTVSNNPYAIHEFSDARLEDFYRCSMMSEKDIENMIRNFEIEEEAVRSLRKK